MKKAAMKKGKKAKGKVAAKDLRPKKSAAQAVKGGGFRITNVRANASSIGAATTLVPSQIIG